MVETTLATFERPAGIFLCLPSTAVDRRSRSPLMVILVFYTLAACSVLPTTTETAESPWESFEDAKTAYDAVAPTQTTKAELTELGYDPLETPNVRVLSYPTST